MIRSWIKEHDVDWVDVIVAIVAVALFVSLIVVFGNDQATCSITSTPNIPTTVPH